MAVRMFLLTLSVAGFLQLVLTTKEKKILLKDSIEIASNSNQKSELLKRFLVAKAYEKVEIIVNTLIFILSFGEIVYNKLLLLFIFKEYDDDS